MAKFSLPKREFTQGDKKMMSIRLPIRLMKELDALADEYGWTTTDVIQTALDQFVVWSRKQRGKDNQE